MYHLRRSVVKFYGPDGNVSFVVNHVTGLNTTGFASHNRSMVNQGGVPFMNPDPLVTLFGIVNETIPEAGSMPLSS